MKKIKTLAKLKKDLDTVFSRYIRMRGAVDGIAECYTCSVKKPWKEMDAGHFQSRKHLATRWNEDGNVMPQCKRCNIFNSGEQYTFAKLLDVRIADGTSDKLYALARTTVKYMRCDYEEMIKHYKKKVEDLLNE